MTGQTANHGLDGAAALVTGASSGIGRATVHALAAEGASIALAARREDRLRDVAAEIENEFGAHALVLPTDVSDERAVEATVEATVSEFDGLDVVVNNAGVGRGRGRVDDLDMADYRMMTDVNVDGVFYVTRAAIPHLRESSGNLVFLGSIAGRFPYSKNPVYAATKWWVRGFALSVEASEGADDVAVSVVHPGTVRTEFGWGDGTTYRDEYEAGEVISPAEVAEAVAFAARQDHATVSELDLFQRDVLGGQMNL